MIFGRAVGRVLINAGIGRMSALGANRTRLDGGKDVNDPTAAMHGLTCYTYRAISGLRVNPMRRREFITLLGGALAAQAIPANAQELRVRTVGVLMGFANDAEAKARVQAFEQGLDERSGH